MATNQFVKKVVGDKVRTVAPIKIFAVLLSLVAVIWLVISVAGEKWVIVTFQYFEDSTWDWGLWNTCHSLADEFSVCVSEDWLTVCLVCSIIALILSIAATLCGGFGIRFAETDFQRNIFYTGAAGFLTAVVLLELMVVIIFPAKFGEDIMKSETVKCWNYDWSYGFACGGLIFSLGAIIFLLIPERYMTLTLVPGSSTDLEASYSPGYTSQEGELF